jgi:hypothetical protein
LKTDSKARGKALFLSLSVVGFIISGFLAWGIWLFISPRLHHITPIIWLNKFLVHSAIIGLRTYFFLLFFGTSLILLTSLLEKNFLITRFAVRLSIRFLFPVAVFLGKRLGFSKDEIGESYVHVNNSFAKAIENVKFKPKDILILLPHCLQFNDCKVRITNDIKHCTECGLCDIAELKKVAEKYSVNIAIATGGTLARRIIIENRPKFIIAVACQRDLVSGMQDVFPIPVFGVLNTRPNGPCISTRVAVQEIEEILERRIKK